MRIPQNAYYWVNEARQPGIRYENLLTLEPCVSAYLGAVMTYAGIRRRIVYDGDQALDPALPGNTLGAGIRGYAHPCLTHRRRQIGTATWEAPEPVFLLVDNVLEDGSVDYLAMTVSQCAGLTAHVVEPNGKLILVNFWVSASTAGPPGLGLFDPWPEIRVGNATYYPLLSEDEWWVQDQQESNPVVILCLARGMLQAVSIETTDPDTLETTVDEQERLLFSDIEGVISPDQYAWPTSYALANPGSRVGSAITSNSTPSKLVRVVGITPPVTTPPYAGPLYDVVEAFMTGRLGDLAGTWSVSDLRGGSVWVEPTWLSVMGLGGTPTYDGDTSTWSGLYQVGDLAVLHFDLKGNPYILNPMGGSGGTTTQQCSALVNDVEVTTSDEAITFYVDNPSIYRIGLTVTLGTADNSANGVCTAVDTEAGTISVQFASADVGKTILQGRSACVGGLPGQNGSSDATVVVSPDKSLRVVTVDNEADIYISILGDDDHISVARTANEGEWQISFDLGDIATHEWVENYVDSTIQDTTNLTNYTTTTELITYITGNEDFWTSIETWLGDNNYVTVGDMQDYVDWVLENNDDDPYIPNATMTQIGDVIIGTGSGTYAVLSINQAGTDDGKVLTVVQDSANGKGWELRYAGWSVMMEFVNSGDTGFFWVDGTHADYEIIKFSAGEATGLMTYDITDTTIRTVAATADDDTVVADSNIAGGWKSRTVDLALAYSLFNKLGQSSGIVVYNGSVPEITTSSAQAIPTPDGAGQILISNAIGGWAKSNWPTDYWGFYQMSATKSSGAWEPVANVQGEYYHTVVCWSKTEGGHGPFDLCLPKTAGLYFLQCSAEGAYSLTSAGIDVPPNDANTYVLATQGGTFFWLQH